jgi:glyoxylase-like metal-dependent hydrolase (beta-lactamase superfamily II)
MELIKQRFANGDNFLPMTDAFLKNHGFPESELVPPEIQLPIPDDMNLINPDVLLMGGEEIQAGQYTLKVINTPGHTPGHIILYEPDKKFVFSGDMLLPTIATNAAFHVAYIQNPLKKYISTLKELQKMDIRMILPGHEHVYTNPSERIDELLIHYEQKADEIFRIFRDRQPKTAYEVSRILAWSNKSNTTNWDKLTAWEKRFAVLQSISYLEEMAYADKLIRLTKDGKINYRRV